MRKACQTDLSDAEWSHIEPHLPVPKASGRPKIHTTREILDAIFFYVLGDGCAWRLLPHDLERRVRPSTITSVSGAKWMALGKGSTPQSESASSSPSWERSPA